MIAHLNTALFLSGHIHQIRRKPSLTLRLLSYHCARSKIAYILNDTLLNKLNYAMKSLALLVLMLLTIPKVLFLVRILQSQVDFQKIDGILGQFDVSWDNCTSFGVDNTNSNIVLVMKFVKPLVMQLYRDSNIPYADSKLYIGLVTSSVIRKKCTADPFNFLDSFCILVSKGPN